MFVDIELPERKHFEKRVDEVSTFGHLPAVGSAGRFGRNENQTMRTEPFFGEEPKQHPSVVLFGLECCVPKFRWGTD